MTGFLVFTALLIVIVAVVSIPLAIKTGWALLGWTSFIILTCSYFLLNIHFRTSGNAPSGAAAVWIIMWLLLTLTMGSCGFRGYILYQGEGGTLAQLIKNIIAGALGIVLIFTISVITVFTLGWFIYIFI